MIPYYKFQDFHLPHFKETVTKAKMGSWIFPEAEGTLYLDARCLTKILNADGFALPLAEC